MLNDFALVVSLDDSFSQNEAPDIIEHFVCAVCWGDLHEVFVPNSPRVLIVCFEHGNICDCGRVTKTTVSIEMEEAIKRFYGAVLALPDLWPELVERGFSREHAERFAKSYVCGICGRFLITQLDLATQKYDVVCSGRCGSIHMTGYTKREHFVYDHERERAWYKKLRQERMAV